jgi:nucleotide-binding universal stress UspA family protein
MLPTVKTILYATDLSPESPFVFRYAMSLAQQYDASIHIVSVLEPLGGFAQNLVQQYMDEDPQTFYERSKKTVVDKITQRLQNFCEQEVCVSYDDQHVVTDISVEEGPPADTIIEKAQQIGADLIVMGTHRDVWTHALVGSTARKVVNRSPVPVLVVRPEEKRSQGS